MMRADRVFRIVGRTAVVVTLDGPEPRHGDTVRRLSDGATWPLVGVEWHAIPCRPRAGERVALVFREGTPIEEGDEIEVAR